MRGRSTTVALFSAALMPLIALMPGSAQARPVESSLGSTAVSSSVGLPLAASSDSARSAYGVRITLRASASTVLSGSEVTVSGKAYGVRPRTRIVFNKKMSGASDWSVIGSARVNRRGEFKYTETVTGGSRYYSACALRKCSRAVSVTMSSPALPTVPPVPTPTITTAPTPAPKPTSAPTPTPTPTPTPAPKVQPTLTVASATPPSLTAGEKITVTGTSTNLAGQVVHLQSTDAAGKVWGDVGTATVNPDGSWSVVGTLTRAGKSISLQVTAVESATTLAVTTAIPPVTVYGWVFLTDPTPPDKVAGDSNVGSWSINGVTYANSFSPWTGSSVEYNLSRSCTRFEATIGIEDRAPSTLRTQSRIYADSVQLYTKSDIALGQSFPVSLDVSNALRLRFETTITTGSGQSTVYGNARALCAF